MLKVKKNLEEKKLKQTIKDSIKGRAKAQESLYVEYAPKMMGVCLRYAKSYDEAEDILHDGFIKVFHNLKSFRFDGSFEGWMRRVFVNTALERFRTKKQLQYLDEIEDVESDKQNSLKEVPLELMLKMIQNLPERYRMTFNLYALDGYSHNKIAELMQITVGTSKSNLARARLILKNEVKAYWNKQKTSE